MRNKPVYIWSVVGYMGAVLVLLAGAACLVLALIAGSRETISEMDAVIYGVTGMLGAIVAAPVLGCLAKIADALNRSES